jgi:hypothetical protein
MEELLDYNSENFGVDNKYRTVEDVIANGYELSIGEAIKGGWDLAISKIWYFIAAFVLTAIISSTLSSIPYVGSIASFIISTPMYAGLSIFAYKLINKEQPQFEFFFEGFKTKLWPLVISNLIVYLMVIVAIIPLFVIIGFAFFQGMMGFNNPDPSYYLELLKEYGIILFVYFLGLMSLFVLLIQHSNILLFQNKSPWDSIKASIAIVSKKYIHYIGLLFLLFFINLLGLLCLGIGVLVTIPVSICSIFYCYELTFKKI